MHLRGAQSRCRLRTLLGHFLGSRLAQLKCLTAWCHRRNGLGANWTCHSMSPNNAFERPRSLSSRARVRRTRHIAPSARLKALRSAAQRKR